MERAHIKYPNLSIDIVVDITPTLREALQSGELDMAFVLGPQQDGELLERELCNYELNFLSAPSLKVAKKPLSNDALAEHPIFTFPKRTYPYTGGATTRTGVGVGMRTRF